MMRQNLETFAKYNVWATNATDAQLACQLTYTTMRGARASLPFVPTLMHVFNHSTHHRWQITAALTMMGHPAPELDMVYFLQQEQTS